MLEASQDQCQCTYTLKGKIQRVEASITDHLREYVLNLERYKVVRKKKPKKKPCRQIKITRIANLLKVLFLTILENSQNQKLVQTYYQCLELAINTHSSLLHSNQDMCRGIVGYPVIDIQSNLIGIQSQHDQSSGTLQIVVGVQSPTLSAHGCPLGLHWTLNGHSMQGIVGVLIGYRCLYYKGIWKDSKG